MNTVNPRADSSLVEVTVDGVRADSAGGPMMLVLADPAGDRRLPIYIGATEAMAIKSALEQVAHDRPMTHDALKETLEALGQLVRIVIGYEGDMNAFTADVVLTLSDGTERHLDWRVSDSIAVAVRCEPRPPILVPESILALPPPLIDGVRVRCPCGEMIQVDEAGIVAAGHAGQTEADVECPSCGLRRHMRFQASPAFGPGGAWGQAQRPPPGPYEHGVTDAVVGLLDPRSH